MQLIDFLSLRGISLKSTKTVVGCILLTKTVVLEPIFSSFNYLEYDIEINFPKRFSNLLLGLLVYFLKPLS